MTAPQGVPIARIPAHQPLELFSAVGDVLDAALHGAMLVPGNGGDVAATIVARDGQTVSQVIAELRHAASVLAAAAPASATPAEPVDDPDDPEEPTTVGQLRRGETGWTASLGGGAAQAALEMAQQMLAAFIPAFEETKNAPNYLSWDAVYQPTGQRYSLIVVRSDGLTPHEARQRAEQECARPRRTGRQGPRLLLPCRDALPRGLPDRYRERRKLVTTTASAQRERCVKSELWPEECAHCRGLQLDVGDLAEVRITRRWRALRSGTCPTCGHQYDEGDLVMRTEDGEMVCERCRA